MYSSVSVHCGPLNEFNSPQPRMSSPFPHGMMNRPITKHRRNFHSSTSCVFGKAGPEKKNSAAPTSVPATTIGCRRVRRRLKKPQVLILPQRSS